MLVKVLIAEAEVLALDEELPSSGGLATIIEKFLSAVFEPAVALKVKLRVVSFVTSFGSPVIAPVDELSVRPAPPKTFEVVSE